MQEKEEIIIEEENKIEFLTKERAILGQKYRDLQTEHTKLQQANQDLQNQLKQSDQDGQALEKKLIEVKKELE